MLPLPSFNRSRPQGLDVVITAFIAWLWAKLFSSVSATPPSTPSVSASVVTDVGAVAGAVEEGEKIADVIVTAENTPAMIQARKNVEVQKEKDAINNDIRESLKTGDVTKINQDLA